MRETTHGELVDQLRTLGVDRGVVVQVHTSFRAVRPVEGGPDGLIEALVVAVGPDGTVVMPSWPGDADDGFDATAHPASADLGVVADRFWRRPDALRNDHPMAFAAAGADATAILRDPLPLPPHRPESPVGRVRDLDGLVLLLGVHHDADTTIHLGEIEGGARYRVPKECTIRRDGRLERITYGENDHCCRRFRLVDDWLDAHGLQRRGRVGHADARLVRARDVVDVVAARVRKEPEIFLHERDSGCDECDRAWKSLVNGDGAVAVVDA